MDSVYDAVGAERLAALADAWHRRVLADDVVSHAFHGGAKHDHADRLAAYWAEALGGPADYSSRFGDESSVVRMHSGNGEHHEMDERAIACFDAALADVGLDADERLARTLHDYFAWATTSSMAQYPSSQDDVPTGMPMPRWSWDGLVSA